MSWPWILGLSVVWLGLSFAFATLVGRGMALGAAHEQPAEEPRAAQDPVPDGDAGPGWPS